MTLFAYLTPYVIAYLLPACVVTAAAWQDWQHLQIANKHALVLLILFPILTLLCPGLFFLSGLLAGLLTLFLGLLLFVARLTGGGDVKLAAVIALYLGMGDLPYFMLGTALTGGGLAIAALIARHYPVPATDPRTDWLTRIRQGGADIPYGVAMAVPTWFLLTQRLIAAYDHVLSL